MEQRSVTIRILSLLKGQKKMVVFLLSLILIGAALDITVPFLSQRLIDTLVRFLEHGGEAPYRVLFLIAFGILAATVGNRVISSVYNVEAFKVVTRAEDNARHAAFEKYLRLHALFHHGASSGQLIGRIERGATAIYVILYDIFGQSLVSPIITLTGVLIALAVKSPWIALVVFLPLPVYLLIVRHLTARIYEIEKRVNEEYEDVSKEAYDVASNVFTVKKFSQEDAETTNHVRLLQKMRLTQYSAEQLWGIIETTQTIIATLGRLGVILLGGTFVVTGRSTIGEFVLFITLQNMAYSPLAQLSVIFPRLRRNLSRAERIFAVLDEPIHVTDKPEALVLPPLAHEITFDRVSFRYGPQRAWALKDLDLRIPAGTTVALVGRSGSGKTTFVNLLLRAFDPIEGTVRIDGHDLRDVTQKSLHDQIAVVPQEVDLFSRTIAQNIAYGASDPKPEDIEQAARTALAHDFIMKTENGYDTLVGERGVKLSGGERQRVGIARAVFRNPRILILDEATSHLDTESERLIQQATAALIKDRTSFIIAHRLSTILHADLILVFSQGSIEAAGKHEELLKTSSTYQRLYSLQFAS
ncbi:MAG TPA: ABC transporter ATP-binding protein [Candidatus Paceibacterota bacterium]|nr:ABC transporter ATP-binding protein [Candidatus Paceibacterota bacterium]